MQIGYIGLGRMGKNMVLRLLEQGIQVIAWNRSVAPLDEVVQAGAEGSTSIKDLVNHLPTPRVIWLMLPAGEVTDEYIDQLIPLLQPGDLLIDGGNSFYKDTLRRNDKLAKHDIHFMDIGTSGGPGGARTGACLMIGGNLSDYQKIKELIVAAAAPDAYGYFGPIGSGHFAKMVHNGIEYGMMEAIGEGATILKNSQFDFDLGEVFRVYNHRSVIESRLVGWTEEALAEDPDLSQISSVVNSTGEGEWTIKTAKEMGITVPVIEASFAVRQNSTQDQEDSPAGFRNKVVSAQRGKFGHHAVNKE